MTKALSNLQIADEAADWAVRLDAGSLNAEEKESLAKWLTASPLHVDELLISAAILGCMSRVDGKNNLSIDALLDAAGSEVIPLPHPPRLETDEAERFESGEGGKSRTRIIKAVAVVMLLLMGSLLFMRQPSELSAPANTDVHLVATEVGEQRSIALDDGSVVHLNTNSIMRISFTAARRKIELLSGEALFEVAHDPARPFQVYADSTIIEAIGTEFNVRREARGLNVVVVEGSIVLKDQDAESLDSGNVVSETIARIRSGGSRLVLAAGEEAQIARKNAINLTQASDVSEATLWRLRKISFEDERLDLVTQDFNRYNRTQIEIADSRLGQRRISGMFRADDPESFLDFLEFSEGVRVERPRPGIVKLYFDGN